MTITIMPLHLSNPLHTLPRELSAQLSVPSVITHLPGEETEAEMRNEPRGYTACRRSRMCVGLCMCVLGQGGRV